MEFVAAVWFRLVCKVAIEVISNMRNKKSYFGSQPCGDST